jgi:hypothetical protein
VRVAAGDRPAAVGRLVPLAVVAQIWQRVPGGMPLTLASSSVPQGCGV